MGRKNDPTQGMAQGAVAIAAIRSGGTFLSHCLSNHPEIFCARGEPLHHDSVWVRTLKPERQALLAAMLNQTGYRVSMCKLTYTQALQRDMWAWLVQRQPKVVWLRRENYVRQAVSVLLNKKARGGKLKRPQHTFRELSAIRVELEPAAILKTAHNLQALDGRTERMLAARMKAVLAITYNQVVGGEGDSADRLPPLTARRLCEFLGVRVEPMGCDLQRVNPYPLRALLGNWKQVEKAVKGSDMAHCLLDEGHWCD